MTGSPSDLAPSFVSYLESLNRDEVAAQQDALLSEAEREHIEFSTAFTQGECYICSKPLATFSATSPCLHWLLRPKGFKKKHFPLIAEAFGFLQIQSYVRWVANQDKPFRNINDLPEEGSGKFIESTIRYRHIEWSFSCDLSDLRGHATSAHSAYPHYHFQMRLDGRPFIDFGDFHVRMTHADALQLEALRLRPDMIRAVFPYGEGIRDLLENEAAIVQAMSSPGAAPSQEGEAPLRIQSVIEADEGSFIQGEHLYELIQEARERGVTVASLLEKLPNSSAEITVYPGDGVVPQTTRSGGR